MWSDASTDRHAILTALLPIAADIILRDGGQSWLAPVSALAGALLGGVLTGGAQLFMRRREEKRDLLVAARLTWDELQWARWTIEWILQNDHWSPLDDLTASIDTVWATTRATLYGNIQSKRRWRDLSSGIRTWQSLRAVWPKDDEPRRPSELPLVRSTGDAVDDALAVLEPLLSPRRCMLWPHPGEA